MTPIKQNKTIGYLRVSTADQNLEKNKADILVFGVYPNKGTKSAIGCFEAIVFSGFSSEF